MAIVIKESNCIGCGSCVLFCPEEALTVLASFIAKVDEQLCTECLICLNCCANDALEDT